MNVDKNEVFCFEFAPTPVSTYQKGVFFMLILNTNKKSNRILPSEIQIVYDARGSLSSKTIVSDESIIVGPQFYYNIPL